MWKGVETSQVAVNKAVELMRTEMPRETRLYVTEARTVVFNGLPIKTYVFSDFDGPPGYLGSRLQNFRDALEEGMDANPKFPRSFSDYVFAIAFLYGFESKDRKGQMVHRNGLDLALFRASSSGSRSLAANLMMDPRSFSDDISVDVRTQGAFCSAELAILGVETELRKNLVRERGKDEANRVYFGWFPGTDIPGQTVRVAPRLEAPVSTS